MEIKLPRYRDLPDLPLYANQMIAVSERILKELMAEEKVPTASMLHNYIVMGLISPPEGKYYKREHLSRLLVICAFKDIFALQEIDALFALQRRYCSTEMAYDTFCSEFERCVAYAAGDVDCLPQPESGTFQGHLLRVMCLSLACKYAVNKMALTDSGEEAEFSEKSGCAAAENYVK